MGSERYPAGRYDAAWATSGAICSLIWKRGGGAISRFFRMFTCSSVSSGRSLRYFLLVIRELASLDHKLRASLRASVRSHFPAPSASSISASSTCWIVPRSNSRNTSSATNAAFQSKQRPNLHGSSTYHNLSKSPSMAIDKSLVNVLKPLTLTCFASSLLLGAIIEPTVYAPLGN